MLLPRYIFVFIAALVIIFVGVNMSLQSFNQDLGSHPAIKAFAFKKESDDSWQINLLGYEQEIKREQLNRLTQYTEMIREECRGALTEAKTWLENISKSVTTSG